MTSRIVERVESPPSPSTRGYSIHPPRQARRGPWTEEHIGDQRGRVAVITGSNSGIGFEAARALAASGAEVILAVRSPSRGAEAQAAIRARVPNAQVAVRLLDLADLSSVETFARDFAADYARLDMLINNAGVMALPYRRSVDGFEMQFATNHLGHFALTGRLLPVLMATAGARVVTVSSMMHQGVELDFDNLNGHKGYSRWRAYQYSKLANLHFAYAFHDRLTAQDADISSVACHPGYTSTNLQIQGLSGGGGAVRRWLVNGMNRLFAQDAAMGALPTLFAAVADGVQGGEYVGPDGLLGVWGHPVITRSSRQSYDRDAAARLWAISESLTGVRFALA